MKRRTIGPNKRSYTGRHVGRPGQQQVRFESGLERDFLLLKRFGDGAVEIVEQPFTLKFVDSLGKNRIYTPDFKVTYPTKTVIYELKYRKQLRDEWETTYREPYSFMRKWAPQQGWTFRIATELTVRGLRFENAWLLSSLAHNPIDPEIEARIHAALGGGPRTILELLQFVCGDPAERGAVYATLWPMIVQRKLKSDLDRPVSMSMIVEIPDER